MKRAVGLFLALLAIAAYAQQPIPTEPVVMTLPELLKGVHLYGCQIQLHLAGDHTSECLSLRRAILAAAQTGAIVARRQAFEDAAQVVRDSRSLRGAAEALDRRAAD